MTTATKTTELATPTHRAELQTLEQRGAALPAKLETQEQYTACVRFIGDCRTWTSGVEKYFEDSKSKAHKAWQAICTAITGLTNPVKALETKADELRKDFERRQEQKKAEDEARRQAEIKAAEDAEREITAMMAEEEGDVVAAEAVRAAPSIAAPVSLPTSTYYNAKAGGGSRRKKWKAEVTSLKELAGGVWRGEVPEAALLGLEQKDDGPIRSSFLDARAAEYKSKLPYPGVRAYQDSSLAFR